MAKRSEIAAVLMAMGLTALLPASAALAQDPAWPSKPITIVVPYAAGSLTDTTARLYAEVMKDVLKQPVLIDNRPGAATRIGMRKIATSAPDGYTVGMVGAITTAVQAVLIPDIEYKLSDFTSVATTGVTNVAFSLNPDIPAKTVQEFIAYAKTKPNELIMGTTGNGSISHLAGALFARKAGIEIRFVPYKAVNNLTLDQIAGRIHLQASTLTQQSEPIRTGQLRGLGVASRKRDPLLPDMPTFEESGFRDYYITSTLGAFVPAGTPPEIVKKLNEAFNAASMDKNVKEKLAVAATYADPGPPEEFFAIIKEEIDKYGPVIKEFGIKMDE